MLVMRRVPAGVPISRAMLLLLLLILWVARVARMVLLVSWSALGAVYLGAVGATMWGVARLRWIRVATTSFSSLWLLSVLMPVLLVARSVGYVHRVTRSSSRNHTIVKASPSPLRSHTRLLLLRWPCDTRHRGERRVSSGPTAITTPAPRIARFSARSKLIVRAAAADAETMCAGPTVTRPLGPASTPPPGTTLLPRLPSRSRRGTTCQPERVVPFSRGTTRTSRTTRSTRMVIRPLHPLPLYRRRRDQGWVGDLSRQALPPSSVATGGGRDVRCVRRCCRPIRRNAPRCPMTTIRRTPILTNTNIAVRTNITTTAAAAAHIVASTTTTLLVTLVELSRGAALGRGGKRVPQSTNCCFVLRCHRPTGLPARPA